MNTNATEMAAGRELDAKIAKLMGWRNVGPATFPTLDGTSATVINGAPPWAGNDERVFHVPYYSIEMNAAWHIAERLKLAVMPYGDDGWLAQTTRFPPFVAHAETAPLAICRAALAATAAQE